MNTHTIEQANESLAKLKATIEAAIAEHLRAFQGYQLDITVYNNEVFIADGSVINNYDVRVAMKLKGTSNG